MTIQELLDQELFALVIKGADTSIVLTEIFCCDLMSVAMSRAPADGVWVTAMGNMNMLAVASLTEVACIILAEGAELDEQAMKKAIQEDITVLKTEESIFDSALAVHECRKR